MQQVCETLLVPCDPVGTVLPGQPRSACASYRIRSALPESPRGAEPVRAGRSLRRPRRDTGAAPAQDNTGETPVPHRGTGPGTGSQPGWQGAARARRFPLCPRTPGCEPRQHRARGAAPAPTAEGTGAAPAAHGRAAPPAAAAGARSAFALSPGGGRGAGMGLPCLPPPPRGAPALPGPGACPAARPLHARRTLGPSAGADGALPLAAGAEGRAAARHSHWLRPAPPSSRWPRPPPLRTPRAHGRDGDGARDAARAEPPGRARREEPPPPPPPGPAHPNPPGGGRGTGGAAPPRARRIPLLPPPPPLEGAGGRQRGPQPAEPSPAPGGTGPPGLLPLFLSLRDPPTPLRLGPALPSVRTHPPPPRTVSRMEPPGPARSDPVRRGFTGQSHLPPRKPLGPLGPGGVRGAPHTQCGGRAEQAPPRPRRRRLSPGRGRRDGAGRTCGRRGRAAPRGGRGAAGARSPGGRGGRRVAPRGGRRRLRARQQQQRSQRGGGGGGFSCPVTFGSHDRERSTEAAARSPRRGGGEAASAVAAAGDTQPPPLPPRPPHRRHRERERPSRLPGSPGAEPLLPS